MRGYKWAEGVNYHATGLKGSSRNGGSNIYGNGLGGNSKPTTSKRGC